MLHKNPKHTLYIATVIALSVSLWKIFFSFWAYGEISFEYIFTIIFMSLALSIGIFFIEPKERPIGPLGQAFLLLPLIGFATSYLYILDSIPYMGEISLVVDMLIIGFSLPYLLWVFLMATSPDMADILDRKMLIGIVLVSLCISGTSYLFGKYNQHFIYCRDFKISGMETPLACYSAKENKIINWTYE